MLPGSRTRPPHRHRDDLFTNINRSYSFIHDLHHGLPPTTSRHVTRGTRNNIKSLRLTLKQAATRSTPPGRAPASIFETGFETGSPRTRTTRRQRATHPEFQRPASAAPAASESLSSRATVSGPTRCPWAVSSSASFTVDLVVHRSRDIGAHHGSQDPQPVQCRPQSRIWILGRFPPGTGRADPPIGHDPRLQLRCALPDRVRRSPSGGRDQLDPTPPQLTRTCPQQQPPRTLVQNRSHRPAQPRTPPGTPRSPP